MDTLKLQSQVNLKQEVKLSAELKEAINILSYDIVKLNENFENISSFNEVLSVESNIKKEIEIYASKEVEDPIENNYNSEEYFSSNYYIQTYINENFEHKKNKKQSLHDSLIMQLNTLDYKLEEHLYNICDYIIYNINSKGYLTISLKQLREDLSISKEDAVKALSIVQSFEPISVGARNFTENIIIKLKKAGIYEKEHKILLKSYLKEIAYEQYEKISKKTKIDISYVKSLISDIKKCDPIIARDYEDEEISYIIPEVVVTYENNEINVSLKDDLYPILIKNKEIMSYIDVYDKKSEEYKKLKQDIKISDFYIDALNVRKRNLLLVCEYILNIQKDFFTLSSLNPLTMEEVANNTNLNLSTISRIVNGKYISTPKGIYNLKFFFSRKISSSTNENISDFKIKKNIKSIIEAEDSKKPFSDDKICEMLKSEGVKISRRTVTKYRESMNIPSSYMRKK